MTRRIVVTGSVQGVGYRAWAVREARRLRLSGWVRNRRDGSVEIVASGSDEAIADLIEKCRRGPPTAQVATVTDAPASDKVALGFEQR